MGATCTAMVSMDVQITPSVQRGGFVQQILAVRVQRDGASNIATKPVHLVPILAVKQLHCANSHASGRISGNQYP